MNECFECGKELRPDGEAERNLDYVQVGDKKMCVACWRKAFFEKCKIMNISDMYKVFIKHNHGWAIREKILEAISKDGFDAAFAESILSGDDTAIQDFLMWQLHCAFGNLNEIIPRGLAKDLIEWGKENVQREEN